MSLSRVGLSHLLLYLPSGTTQELSRFLCLSWHSGAQTRAAALQERCCLPGSAPPGAGTEFTGSPDSPSLSRPVRRLAAGDLTCLFIFPLLLSTPCVSALPRRWSVKPSQTERWCCGREKEVEPKPRSISTESSRHSGRQRFE